MPTLSRSRLFVALLAAIFAGLLAVTWDDLNPWLRGVLVLVGVFAAAVGILMNRPAASGGALDPRLGMIEKVVADESRRAWNPTTLPWTRIGSSPKPVLLVPAADYHLAEIVPLSQELNRMGIPTRIAIGESPWSRTWQGLAWYDIEVYELPGPDAIAGDFSAVVVTKDIGTLAPWVQRSRELGIPTIGKVEGAQDFWDVDTAHEWRAYRNVDLVLCQGKFDAEALPDSETAIVGSTRLERLWWAPPVVAAEPLALINLNFTYGARTADRKLWLDSAIEGCASAGIPYLISIHPAEKSKVRSNRMTTISASRLLPHATVLISRFSTMPFEAMARGVPFIYHNPHGENVKTFAESMDGFDVTTSAEDLARALREMSATQVGSRTRSEPFFAAHVDIDQSKRSEERSASVIGRWINPI